MRREKVGLVIHVNNEVSAEAFSQSVMMVTDFHLGRFCMPDIYAVFTSSLRFKSMSEHRFKNEHKTYCHTRRDQNWK